MLGARPHLDNVGYAERDVVSAFEQVPEDAAEAGQITEDRQRGSVEIAIAVPRLILGILLGRAPIPDAAREA